MTEKKSSTEQKTIFESLFGVNVEHHTYSKPVSKKYPNLKLKYMQWAWVWFYLKKFDPHTKLEFKQFPEYDFKSHQMTGRKVDYCDTANGCYVTAILTVKDVTQQQSLPVMDSKNNAIYHPDMMSINKAKQRAFVKCAAMFGLGLRIYGMEDTLQYGNNSNSNYRRSYSNGNNRGNSSNSYSQSQNKKQAMLRKKISNGQIKFIKSLCGQVDVTQMNDKQQKAYSWANSKTDWSNVNMFTASAAIQRLESAPKKPKHKSSDSAIDKTKKDAVGNF